MYRRSLLAGAGAAVAVPRFARSQPGNAKTLIFVPQANLDSLDPIWTTATVTRNYAYLVFDTLYGTDDDLKPQPQMPQATLSPTMASAEPSRCATGSCSTTAARSPPATASPR